MAKGVMVCEGEFEEVITKRSKELLDAYAQGFSDGANKYGAGGAGIYTRDSLAELDPESKWDKPIIAAIEKHLPEVSA